MLRQTGAASAFPGASRNKSSLQQQANLASKWFDSLVTRNPRGRIIGLSDPLRLLSKDVISAEPPQVGMQPRNNTGFCHAVVLFAAWRREIHHAEIRAIDGEIAGEYIHVAYGH